MAPIIHYIDRLLQHTPLELFLLIGIFLEEIISPIPSFIILIPAGVAAHAQHMPIAYIIVLAVIASLAKLVAAAILYALADMLEDALLAKGRRVFGLSHQRVEGLGQRLSKTKPRRLWGLLFFMHAFPAFPGALLSVACGFIKVRFDIFITTTFLGFLVNALFYLGIGYTGLQTTKLLASLDVAAQIGVVALIAAGLTWLGYQYVTMRKRKP